MEPIRLKKHWQMFAFVMILLSLLFFFTWQYLKINALDRSSQYGLFIDSKKAEWRDLVERNTFSNYLSSPLDFSREFLSLMFNNSYDTVHENLNTVFVNVVPECRVKMKYYLGMHYGNKNNLMKRDSSITFNDSECYIIAQTRLKAKVRVSFNKTNYKTGGMSRFVGVFFLIGSGSLDYWNVNDFDFKFVIMNPSIIGNKGG